jgi:hypothetical protein
MEYVPAFGEASDSASGPNVTNGFLKPLLWLEKESLKAPRRECCKNIDQFSFYKGWAKAGRQ